MARRSIDLNADLGEGYGPWSLTDDAGLMSVITSANMACGFHAGDANHMASVCTLAVEHGVSLGAHPGYDDKPYFGRRALTLPLADVTRMVAYQIGAAQAVAALAGTRIRYVKVHGALSNQSAENPALAGALADAIAGVDRELVWLAISGSAHIAAAEERALHYRQEAFIDRAYAANGQLAPRSQPGSVHTDIDLMLHQVEQIVTAGTVTTLDGDTLPLTADSLCLHGDGVHALETARRVRTHIEQLGVAVAPFC
ncbi:MAG: 5-oxoprolinase subunit PxpA [Pseudomonadota bacterium]